VYKSIILFEIGQQIPFEIKRKMLFFYIFVEKGYSLRKNNKLQDILQYSVKKNQTNKQTNILIYDLQLLGMRNISNFKWVEKKKMYQIYQ
jgi:hypothetical protein